MTEPNSFTKLISGLMAKHGIKDRVRLEEVINDAAMAYDGSKFWATDEKRWPNTLWALAEPLDRVTCLLYQQGNVHGVLQALGSYDSKEKAERAVDRREALLRTLGQIRRALPSPPRKRSRGKPSKTKDLYELVDLLAEYWVELTGQPFKQAWVTEKGRREPATTGSTSFVYDVVRFIDASRLVSLPKVTEKVASERRAAASRKSR